MVLDNIKERVQNKSITKAMKTRHYNPAISAKARFADKGMSVLALTLCVWPQSNQGSRTETTTEARTP
jgi:hypothetical protein